MVQVAIAHLNISSVAAELRRSHERAMLASAADKTTPRSQHNNNNSGGRDRQLGRATGNTDHASHDSECQVHGCYPLPLSYPVGRATLQLTGLHLRLVEKSMKDSKAEGWCSRQSLARQAKEGISLPMHISVIVRLQVRGAERDAVPAVYTLAIVPLSCGGTDSPSSHLMRDRACQDDGAGMPQGHTRDAARVTNDPGRGAHRDMRNKEKRPVDVSCSHGERGQQATDNRESRNGSSLTSSSASSVFVKCDVRVQVERVRLLIHLCQNDSGRGKRERETQKRRRHDDSSAHTNNPSTHAMQSDCALEITAIGTMSSLVL